MKSVEHLKSVSASIGKDKYKTDIVLEGHQLVADEPGDIGGTDLGPSPGDFLRMSLASCTAITLRMYADRKGYAVDRIVVKVSSEVVGNKTIFHSHIQLTGTLDEAQRKRLLQIAKACPIHKTLTKPAEILTQIH